MSNQGFLWVGDPQIASVSPGRRVDVYRDAVLNKLEQAVCIANERQLQMVILGDLFDEARDSDATMVTRLIRVLRKAHQKIWCVLGNHDAVELGLTDDAAISILKEAGVIELVDLPRLAIFDTKNGKAAIQFVPYGYPIPEAVSVDIPQERVACVTHADVAFEGAYPGAHIPHEILGARWVVNGHMHLTKPIIHAGNTQWFNPGNISRMTIADKDHLPAVFEWIPGEDKMTTHYLECASNVFDLTGLQVSELADGAMDAIREELALHDASEFIENLRAELSLEMPKSGKADILKEDIAKTAERLQADPQVMDIIALVFQQAVENTSNG